MNTKKWLCGYVVMWLVSTNHLITYSLIHLLFTTYPLIHCLSAATHTGADFLKLAGGARIIALAETAAAVKLDASSFFHNPAGVVGSKNEITFSHSSAPQGDAVTQYLGGIYSLKKDGVMAFGILSYRITPIPVTDEFNYDIGELIWNDWAFSIAYGRNLFYNLAAGINIKYIYRYEKNPLFGKTIGRATAVDSGVLYKIIKNLKLGFACENLGTKVAYSNDPVKDNLPTSLRTGFTYYLLNTRENLLDVSFDLFKEKDDKYRPRISAEYTYLDWLFLRGGYINKAGEISGLNFGLGVAWQGFIFDFASSVNSVFARTIYFSFSKKFY
ncbi:MAG: PorV/PorQ family protein [Elusimicrobiota bacterium]